MNKDIYINADECVVYFLECTLNGFDGEVPEWKDAYFKMLSMKNTYSDIQSLDLVDDWSGEGVKVVCVVRRERTMKSVKEFMESIGYKNTQVSEVKALCFMQLFDDDMEYETNYSFLD